MTEVAKSNQLATVLGPVHGTSIQGTCVANELLYIDLRRLLDSTAQLQIEEQITLAGLGNIRLRPDSSLSNLRLVSVDEAHREVKTFQAAGGHLIVDTARAEDGRNPTALAEISRRSGVHVLMSADFHRPGQSPSQFPLDVIGMDLEYQLRFGVEVPAPNQAPGAPANTVKIQAGVVLVDLSEFSAFQDQGPELCANAVATLKGAAFAQQRTMNPEGGGGAPILLVANPFAPIDVVDQAIAVLAAGGTTAARVLIAGMHGGPRHPLEWQLRLMSSGYTLCFDVFGRMDIRWRGQFYPAEVDSAGRVAELAKLGYSGRLALSQGVRQKLQLTRYGGYGYAHTSCSVVPMLRSLGVPEQHLSAMTRGNMVELLSWYLPPPPIEAPKDFLKCSFCGKLFENIEGQYFHKFSFVYCGTKCLRAHRDAGFPDTWYK